MAPLGLCAFAEASTARTSSRPRGVGLNAPRHFFYDATFWDCLAHLSVERPPGRHLVAPCGMALVMRYSRICERSSPSSRRLIAFHRCTGVRAFAGKRHWGDHLDAAPPSGLVRPYD